MDKGRFNKKQFMLRGYGVKLLPSIVYACLQIVCCTAVFLVVEYVVFGSNLFAPYWPTFFEKYAIIPLFCFGTYSVWIGASFVVAQLASLVQKQLFHFIFIGCGIVGVYRATVSLSTTVHVETIAAVMATLFILHTAVWQGLRTRQKGGTVREV